MNKLRFLLLLISVALCGCAYHHPFEQGNIISSSTAQQIHIGMTSEDVVAKLGSPVLKNIYADQRMTYVYSQQPTRNTTIVKRLIIEFRNDRVTSVE